MNGYPSTKHDAVLWMVAGANLSNWPPPQIDHSLYRSLYLGPNTIPFSQYSNSRNLQPPKFYHWKSINYPWSDDLERFYCIYSQLLSGKTYRHAGVFVSGLFWRNQTPRRLTLLKEPPTWLSCSPLTVSTPVSRRHPLKDGLLDQFHVTSQVTCFGGVAYLSYW